MKWPYTVNVGGVTFYGIEYVVARRQDAFISGMMFGGALGIVGGALGIALTRWWLHV